MIAGVTGHQCLGDEGPWVANALRTVIAEYGIIGGVTSLAAGADQIFARVLGEAGLPFVVVVPSGRYAEAFKDPMALQEYQRLRGLAADVVELTFERPTPTAFFAAGRAVVDRGDVLVAVWDAEPAKGLGGTADVVQYAFDTGKCVIHLNTKRRSVGRLGACG
jgi:hypothetical protein